MKQKETVNFSSIVEASKMLGSMYNMAKQLGVTYTTVFNWCHGKAVPNPLNCMKIEKVTKGKIKKEDIRPDFDWENFKLI